MMVADTELSPRESVYLAQDAGRCRRSNGMTSRAPGVSDSVVHELYPGKSLLTLLSRQRAALVTIHPSSNMQIRRSYSHG